MSDKRGVAGKVLAPLLAAAASVAASYAVRKGPQFVEETLIPWLREAAEGAGGAAEKLPEKARSAVSSSEDLAERLTDRARGVTGGQRGGGDGSLSRDEVSRRGEERAKRREQRRKATRRK